MDNLERRLPTSVSHLVRLLHAWSFSLPHRLDAAWYCGVEAYSAGQKCLVVLSQHPDHAIPSLCTRIETVATRVHRDLLQGADPEHVTWVEHVPATEDAPAGIWIVRLRWNVRYQRFEDPSWKRIQKADLMRRLGVRRWPVPPKPLARLKG